MDNDTFAAVAIIYLSGIALITRGFIWYVYRGAS